MNAGAIGKSSSSGEIHETNSGVHSLRKGIERGNVCRTKGRVYHPEGEEESMQTG